MSYNHPHTIKDGEINLLRGHIGKYFKLYLGLRQPNTTSQKHFVKVARGEELAQTDIEKAFLSFLKLSESEQSIFIDNYDKGSKPNPSTSANKTILNSNTKKMGIYKTTKQKRIDEMHRISGYSTIRARFVRG